MRQDSSVLRATFDHLVNKYPTETGISSSSYLESEDEKQKAIGFTEATLDLEAEPDSLIEDTVNVIRLVKDIQRSGSERAAQRFIISNCQKASDILGLVQLFLWQVGRKRS